MADAAIWAARLAKELPQLAEAAHLLPAGIVNETKEGDDVKLEEGACNLCFKLVAPPAASSSSSSLSPPDAAALTVQVELGREETGYPFRPPTIRILSGQELLPRASVSADGRSVTLPLLGEDAWTPNTSILDLLAALQEALAHGRDDEDDPAAGAMTESYTPGQALSTAKFTGPIFPCTVRQQGGGVLQRYLGVAPAWLLALEADRARLEWVVVVRAQPLLQVAKLKYRRGESLTAIFKDNSKWELHTPAAADCVEAIQGALAALGVQGRKTSQAALNQIERARALVQEARRREAEMGPATGGASSDDVQTIVELYRDAIEVLSSVSDERKQTSEIVALLHAFLQRPDVLVSLEQQASTPPPPPPPPTARGSSASASALMSRLQQQASATAQPLMKGLGQMLPTHTPRRGEVLPRSADEVHSQEDDGLAREERNLLKHGLGQLRRVMADLGSSLGEAPRLRTGSNSSSGFWGAGLDLSLSASGGSLGSTSGGGDGGGGGGGDASPPRGPSSSSAGAGAGVLERDEVEEQLQDLEGMLARATSEFEKLSSPEKREAAAAAAAGTQEEKAGAGADAGAAATSAAAADVPVAASAGASPNPTDVDAASKPADADAEDEEDDDGKEAEPGDEQEIAI